MALISPLGCMTLGLGEQHLEKAIPRWISFKGLMLHLTMPWAVFWDVDVHQNGVCLKLDSFKLQSAAIREPFKVGVSVL